MAGEKQPHGPTLEVAAGLVFRQGKLLITQRPLQSHLGGLWEFPGGKRHPGESYPECLARELREELDIEVEVGERFESLTHSYPAQTVHLEFFLCRWRKNEPRPIGCAAVAWITPAALRDFAFPAADARLLQRLEAAPELWRGP